MSRTTEADNHEHLSETDAIVEQRVGTTFDGKWKLVELLGRGGMAAVYRAQHSIGRFEAIKILHPQLAGRKDLVTRLEREAHAANRIDHPAVVQIRDFGVSDDGEPF